MNQACSSLISSLLCCRICLRALFVPLINLLYFTLFAHIKFMVTCYSMVQIALHLSLFMLQSSLEYGAVLILVKFVLLEVVLLIKDWWRCTVVDSGELCVMIHSVELMLTLYVDNWDMREHMTMIISACEKFVIFLVTHRSCSLIYNINIVVVVGTQVSQSGWTMFRAAHRMFVQLIASIVHQMKIVDILRMSLLNAVSHIQAIQLIVKVQVGLE